MTDNSYDQDYIATPATAVARRSQATAVEQSRAAEEVRAAVVVAQQCPRDLDAARREMRQSCAQMGLADKAFYEVPRAGEKIIGASIHLARELARCYGNFQSGFSELDRDDVAGYSEITAWAWDVERNVRSSRTFRVMHKGGKGGNTPLKSEQDIYTNNSNAAARRLREVIFSLLPPWFKEEAEDLCRRTLIGPADELNRRAENAIASFNTTFKVELAQLERRIGKPRPEWTGEDVADLGILFNSLRRKEITREEAFPPDRSTAAEVAATAAAASALAAPDTTAPTTIDESDAEAEAFLARDQPPGGQQ